MPRNPAVDKYIANSAEFARPILTKIRALFHQACPNIEETMKWSFPHFEYKGIVGSMAAFKAHASFGFWKGDLMKDKAKLLTTMGNTSMGHAKITSLADLPPDDVLLAYIKEAVELNEQGVKADKPRKEPKKPLTVPAYFLNALKKNKKAQATFLGFSPSHQREYVEWVTEAKQEKTRDERLAKAITMMAEGKSRHWKYQKKQV